MNDTAMKGLSEIATRSDNDIITLLIVVIIGIPLIILYIKAKSNERHQRHREQMERDAEHREREKTYMDVISGNTAALVKLSTLLETNNQNCTECRAEQTSLYKELIDKQDAMHIDVIKIKERI